MLTTLFNKTSLIQLFRYGAIGLSINMAGYLLYLFLTSLGAEPKVVITVFYPLALALSFLGNRKYTFASSTNVRRAVWRYVQTHALGYFINLAMLYVLVDIYHFNHRIVQFAAIFVVAGFLFLSFKFYVFKEK